MHYPTGSNLTFASGTVEMITAFAVVKTENNGYFFVDTDDADIVPILGGW
jgi:hypothetical protein